MDDAVTTPSAARVHRQSCPLCEAMCGLRVEFAKEQLVSIRGDREDPFSRGYICPKALALGDIHEDPDRLTRPMRRRGERWEEISWDEALAEAAEGLAKVQLEHGRDALALYQGNPTIHNYGVQLAAPELQLVLGTRACFSTASMDHLPHLLVAYLMFGHQMLMPVPDVDRTEFMLMLGANPVVSNGSLMTAGGARRRLQALRERGGKLVVVDPRRSRSAELADRHYFIRPGRDALLLAAMINVVFAEQRVELGRLEPLCRGLGEVEGALARFTPEAVAERVGIEAEDIRALAREFASAESAVCYGRIGLCTQSYGALSVWLAMILNAITGNLDSPGGAMFTNPAADVVKVGASLGMTGSFGDYRSRVRELPEFGGELPIASLAEEIRTPGEGQIRGLVTISGNPVLSSPNGGELERALPELDFMVSVDIYLNETTRHADLILPPRFGLERDHYDLSMSLLAVRNVARYSEPAVAPRGDTRPEADIVLALAEGIGRRTGGGLRGLRARAVRSLGMRRLLALVLRFGPHGAGLNPLSSGLTLARLAAEPHGVDLGALQPALPGRLYTADRRVDLAPERLVADLDRLQRSLDEPSALPPDALELIGRRLLRSNNSWMHNSERLVKGKPECVLHMHPRDADARGISSGQRVQVQSRTGELTVTVMVTDSIAPGVVSLPHGFGHGRPGIRLRVAQREPGVSLNDITDERRIDPVSGTVAFSGTPVVVKLFESIRDDQ